MTQSTVQKTTSDTREQELTKEVLRLQEQVDTLTSQREMLQRELFRVTYEKHHTKDDARY